MKRFSPQESSSTSPCAHRARRTLLDKLLRKLLFPSLCGLVLSTALCGTAVAQTTYTIDGNANDPPTTYQSLSDAFTAAGAEIDANGADDSTFQYTIANDSGINFVLGNNDPDGNKAKYNASDFTLEGVAGTGTTLTRDNAAGNTSNRTFSLLYFNNVTIQDMIFDGDAEKMSRNQTFNTENYIYVYGANAIQSFEGKVTISNTVFQNTFIEGLDGDTRQTVGVGGGGLYMASEGKEAELTGVSFLNNTARQVGNDGSSDYGGYSAQGGGGHFAQFATLAIDGDGTATVTDNKAITEDGGYATGGGLFIQNTIASNPMNVTVKDMLVDGNSAEGTFDRVGGNVRGGGIAVTNNQSSLLDATFSGMTFDGNKAIVNTGTEGGNASGGGLAVFGATGGNINTTITDSTFTGNFAETAEGTAAGGALYISDLATGTVEITGSDFTDNYAKTNSGKAAGGALHISDLTIGTVEIVDTDFTNNYVESDDDKADGGAIWTNQNITIKATGNNTVTFDGNTAKGSADATARKNAITLADATATFDVAENARIVDNDGIDGEDGKLLKTGAGTLELNGVYGYSGSTTVEAGTVVLGSENALLASSKLDIQNASTVQTNYSQLFKEFNLASAATFEMTDDDLELKINAGTIAGTLDGVAAFTKQTAGALTLGKADALEPVGVVNLKAGTTSSTFDQTFRALNLDSGATLSMAANDLTLGSDDSDHPTTSVLAGTLAAKDLTVLAGNTVNATSADLALTGTYTGQAGSTFDASGKTLADWDEIVLEDSATGNATFIVGAITGSGTDLTLGENSIFRLTNSTFDLTHYTVVAADTAQIIVDQGITGVLEEDSTDHWIVSDAAKGKNFTSEDFDGFDYTTGDQTLTLTGNGATGTSLTFSDGTDRLDVNLLVLNITDNSTLAAADLTVQSLDTAEDSTIDLTGKLTVGGLGHPGTKQIAGTLIADGMEVADDTNVTATSTADLTGLTGLYSGGAESNFDATGLETALTDVNLEAGSPGTRTELKVGSVANDTLDGLTLGGFSSFTVTDGDLNITTADIAAGAQLTVSGDLDGVDLDTGADYEAGSMSSALAGDVTISKGTSVTVDSVAGLTDLTLENDGTNTGRTTRLIVNNGTADTVGLDSLDLSGLDADNRSALEIKGGLTVGDFSDNAFSGVKVGKNFTVGNDSTLLGNLEAETFTTGTGAKITATGAQSLVFTNYVGETNSDFNASGKSVAWTNIDLSAQGAVLTVGTLSDAANMDATIGKGSQLAVDDSSLDLTSSTATWDLSKGALITIENGDLTINAASAASGAIFTAENITRIDSPQNLWLTGGTEAYLTEDQTGNFEYVIMEDGSYAELLGDMELKAISLTGKTVDNNGAGFYVYGDGADVLGNVTTESYVDDADAFFKANDIVFNTAAQSGGTEVEGTIESRSFTLGTGASLTFTNTAVLTTDSYLGLAESHADISRLGDDSDIDAVELRGPSGSEGSKGAKLTALDLDQFGTLKMAQGSTLELTDTGAHNLTGKLTDVAAGAEITAANADLRGADLTNGVLYSAKTFSDTLTGNVLIDNGTSVTATDATAGDAVTALTLDRGGRLNLTQGKLTDLTSTTLGAQTELRAKSLSTKSYTDAADSAVAIEGLVNLGDKSTINSSNFQAGTLAVSDKHRLDLAAGSKVTLTGQTDIAGQMMMQGNSTLVAPKANIAETGTLGAVGTSNRIRGDVVNNGRVLIGDADQAKTGSLEIDGNWADAKGSLGFVVGQNNSVGSLSIGGTAYGKTSVDLVTKSDSGSLDALGRNLQGKSVSLITALEGNDNAFSLDTGLYNAGKYEFYLTPVAGADSKQWKLGVADSLQTTVSDVGSFIRMNIVSFELPELTRSLNINGPWAKVKGGHFYDDHAALDKYSYQSVQAGWDRAFRSAYGGGAWFTGVYVEGNWSEGKGKYRENRNTTNDHRGRLRSQYDGVGVGIYASRLFQNGWYGDLIGRLSAYNSRIEMRHFENVDANYRGKRTERLFSLAMEFGKRFYLRDGRFTFNPYNRLIFNSAPGKGYSVDYRDVNISSVDVRNQSVDAWTNQLGGRVSWNWWNPRGQRLGDVYLGMDYFQGLGGSFTTVMRDSAGGNWYRSDNGRSKNHEAYGRGTVGVTLSPTDRVMLRTQFDAIFGDVSGWNISLMGAYRF